MAEQTEKKKIDIKKIAADVGKAATTAGESVGKAAVAVTDKTKELSAKTQAAIPLRILEDFFLLYC